MTEENMKSLILWHRRLCHPSHKRLIETIKMSSDIDLDLSDIEPVPCTACDRAKIIKIPSTDPQERAKYVGEIVWCDLGSVKPIAISGGKFFSLIVDDYSRCKSIDILMAKDEVQEALIFYMDYVSARLEALPPDKKGMRRIIRILRIDGGREFGMSLIEKYCKEKAIELVISSPHNQYQNAVPERAIQFIQNEARACSIQMRIPSCFWDRVLRAVVHTINRTQQSSVTGLSPVECFERGLMPERKFSLTHNHLRVLGARCTVLIDENHRIKGEKLDAHGAKGVFLGYQGTHNYVVWLLEGGRFMTTPHVTVYEDTAEPGEPPDPRDIVRSLPQHVQRRLRRRPRQKGVGVKNKDDNVVSEDDTDEEKNQVKRKPGRPKKTVPKPYVCDAPEDDPIITEEARSLPLNQEGDDQYTYSFDYQPRFKDDDHGFYGGSISFGDSASAARQAYEYEMVSYMLEEENDDLFGKVDEVDFALKELSPTYRLMSTLSETDPTFKEAMEGPERDLWIKAIFAEIKENLDRGSFEFVTTEQALHGHLIDAKWVLKEKFTSTGELEKRKARICARGFTQRKGIDYTETAASTARAVHWRMLMALAASLGWHILQIDFIAAYLNGKLKEVIFMKQFPMLKEYFDVYPDMKEKLKYFPESVIRLLNPLYGLKQAGAAWQERVREILAKRGFHPLVTDDAIYLNPDTGDVIASYVDDFLLFGPNKERLQEIARDIAKDVAIKDLGAADWFLGVRIIRSADDGDVRLDQQQYIEKSLMIMGLDELKPEPTPFVKDHMKFAERYNGLAEKEDIFEFASTVGRYNFSSCISRPDTAFATSTWARFMSNPSPKQQQSIKRLSRYLRGTSNLSIRYRKLDSNHPHYKYNALGLHGAVDSSFADDLTTGGSTTGYVFFMAGAPIAWSSKLQSVVTRCTSEAEYVALGAAAAEAAGIRNFLEELGVMPPGPITILEDNTGARKWAEETAMSRKKRHIRVEYHYIRQEVRDNKVKVEYVESKQNPADGLTKPLDHTDFARFVENLGMERINRA